jgi:hypothetical protein
VSITAAGEGTDPYRTTHDPDFAAPSVSFHDPTDE